MESLETLAPWIFLAIMLLGLGYLLLSIILGGMADADLDLDTGFDDADGDVMGLSLSVIAAFCAGFGAIGLTGTLLHWNLLLTILMSLLIGVLFGQALRRVMAFVMRQQSNNLLTKDRLIGLQVRATINAPAGKVGEGLVQEYERLKYPILHIEGDVIQRGDILTIIDVQGGKLLVQ